MPTRLSGKAQPAMSSNSNSQSQLRPMQSVSRGGPTQLVTGRQYSPFPPRPDPHAAARSTAADGGVPQYFISSAGGTGTGISTHQRPYSYIMNTAMAAVAPYTRATQRGHGVNGTTLMGVNNGRHPGGHHHHHQQQQQQESPAAVEAPLPSGLRHYRHDRSYVPSHHQGAGHPSARSATATAAAASRLVSPLVPLLRLIVAWSAAIRRRRWQQPQPQPRPWGLLLLLVISIIPIDIFLPVPALACRCSTRTRTLLLLLLLLHAIPP